MSYDDYRNEERDRARGRGRGQATGYELDDFPRERGIDRGRERFGFGDRGGFESGTGYGGGGGSSAYSGESSWGGQAGYGGSTTRGAYGGGTDYLGQRHERGPLGSEGRFAGRGPRNWRRPDPHVEEDVVRALTRHPGIDASDVEVRVEHGSVYLAGTVKDRPAKRLAEDVAESCSGVIEVVNELRVAR